jgi:polyisoprenoid-binding protein YceI
MRTPVKVAIAAVIVVALATVAGLWWFFNRNDAPAAVNLPDAVEQVSTVPTTTAAAATEPPGTTGAGVTTTAGAPASQGVEGSWAVDTATGEVDFDSATGSFAGFRIEEELAGLGSTTAVGRTRGVTGSMEIDGTTVTAASFEIDLTSIETNDGRRDDQVQRALETGQFPTATFVLAEPIELSEGAAEGQPVSVTAVGDLTLHGVTQRVEFPLEAQLVQDTVVVVGSLEVTFADFGVEVPSARIVISAEDHGDLEVQLLLTRA